MTRIWAIAVAAALATLRPGSPAAAAPAAFDWFELAERLPPPAPGPGSFRNPVLPGFYPDPSIERVGHDFYLVNSTFSWFPGIPVWHSTDLVHWRQIGNAIDRAGQLDFGRLGMSRGVFAPAIAHDGRRFYIVSTCVDCGGNFVITADRPEGPWSDPVWLPKVGGIDPSIFFDEDGSAWIVNNDEPPGGSTYDGHRAIWLHRFDPDRLATTGEPRLLVDGGVDIREKPVWIEGPHLFRHDGRYYLTAAEGGTSVNHSQVIFRADRLSDPFVPAPPGINPILTQRDLDPARPRPVTSAGHADFVKLDDGRWWAMFLATRPYEGNRYNTGRETFLLPVEWRDGWPVILPAGAAIPEIAAAPMLPATPGVRTAPGDIAAMRSDFAGAALGMEWLSMRSAAQPRYRLADGRLLLIPGDPIGATGFPAYVALRQRQLAGTATTSLAFAPAEGESAGLAAVQDDHFFLTLALSRRGGREWIELRRRAGKADPEAGHLIAARLRTDSGPVRLAFAYDGATYRARFAEAGGSWTDLGTADGSILSSDVAGGFTGAMIGPFAGR